MSDTLSNERDWTIAIMITVIFGLILSLFGYSVLCWIGLFGLEKQQWMFANIDFLFRIALEIIRFLILPIYLLIVGALGVLILTQVEYKKKQEESS